VFSGRLAQAAPVSMVIPWKMAKKTVRKRTVLKNSSLFLCIFRFTSVPLFVTVLGFKGSEVQDSIFVHRVNSGSVFIRKASGFA